jgi:biopolymer transport protein ExbD
MARKSRRESLSFELTPLIDVVFLLLIFFMVSSVFKKEELALLLKLPKSEQGQGKQKVIKQVTIELSGEDVALNGKKLSILELAEKLSSIDKKSIINLRAGGEVKYQRLVRVLDLLQKNQLENVSLITEKDGEQK